MLNSVWQSPRHRAVAIGSIVIIFLVSVTFFYNTASDLPNYALASPSWKDKVSPPNVTIPADKWSFERDRKTLSFTEQQCQNHFPDLYYEIDRAATARHGSKISLRELDNIKPVNGYVRGMIYEQSLYIIKTEGEIYSRGLATMMAIHRAIVSSPEPIPNLEFVFNIDDQSAPKAQWSLTRRKNDLKNWLMPDFAYWSWPETKVGSYDEVQQKAIMMEDTDNNPTGHAWPWEKKKDQLLWRGATLNIPLREKLLEVTENKTWADVKILDWHAEESWKKDLKSMDEHCQYKYLVNTAGVSYSGRLKFIQNCRSVIFMHPAEWIVHHSHLMHPDGPDQNYVLVDTDFTQLEEKMTQLQHDEATAKAIANKNVEILRERYLTPAAETCYWRQLFRTWAENTNFEPEFWKKENGQLHWRGVPFESFAIIKKTEWDPY